MNTRPDTSAADRREELRRLRNAMAVDGLSGAGHKRVAELLLFDAGRHITEDRRDMHIAEVTANVARGHAALAAAEAEEAEHLRASLADARAELEQVGAKLADAEARAATVLDAYHLESERVAAHAARAAQAALDRNRYRGQAEAVRELCRVLREEGHIGIARRVEGAMHDADTAAARRHAAIQRGREQAAKVPDGTTRRADAEATEQERALPNPTTDPAAYAQHVTKRVAVTCVDGWSATGVLVGISRTALTIDVGPTAGLRHVPLTDVQHFTSLTDDQGADQ